MFRSPFRAPFGRGIQTKKIAEGGSEASIGIATEAGGQKIAIGGAEVSLSIGTTGGGIKIIHMGGAETTVYIITEAGGMKLARSPPAEVGVSVTADGGGIKIARGGSEAAVGVATEGGGVKADYSAYVYVGAEGGGAKFGIGGAEAAVKIATETVGVKIASDGSEVAVGMVAEAGGVKRAVSGSETGIVVDSTGGGVKKAVGGAEVAVRIEAEGAGVKTAEGGSETAIKASTEAGGAKRAVGGAETGIIVGTEGGGAKRAVGGAGAAIVIQATGGGYRKPEAPPTTPYIVLDRVTETPVCWLDASLVQATEVQDLNTYEDTLRIIYPATGPDADKIAEGRKILTQDRDQNWQLYEIVRPEVQLLADGDYIVAECEHEGYELRTDKLTTKRWLNGLPSQAMADVLALGGCRWNVGIIELNNVVEEAGIVDMNPRAALVYISRTWNGVLWYRVEVDNGKITGRFVDLLQRRGTYTGQRFEFAHNLGGIRVEIDTRELVTAMYGRGMSDEIDIDTDEAKSLTFADAEWSIAEGNPANKPLGQDWVEDTEATALYGKPDGAGGRRPIFGIYDSPEAKTPLTLLQATWTQVQRRSRPRVSIEVKLADLEGLPGFDYEKTRLGDTVLVVARRGEIAVRLEATINRITRNRKDPNQTYLCLGDQVPMGSQTLQSLRDMAVKQDRRRRELDRGRGGQTITVASEDTSLMPWYDDFVVPAGEHASDTINAALDKLRTVGGGRLILKEGAYSIDKELKLYGGETVEGQGLGTVLTLANQSGVTVFDANAFGAPDIENIALKNMALRGNPANNDSGNAIYISNVVNVAIQNLDIRGFRLFGIQASDCKGLLIENSTIEHKYSELWSAMSIWDCMDVLMQGLTVENSNNVECLYMALCEQARIIGNVFRSGYSRNILFHTCPGVVISNNILKDAYTGIYIDFGEGAVITGNDVNSCTNNGIYLSNSNGATIASNVLSNSENAAVYISESSYVDVMSNQCRDSYIGIYIDDAAVKTKASVNDLIENTYGIINYGTDTDTSGNNRVT